MKKLAIAGIDPGTTSSFALIGLDRRLIKADSRKDFSADEMIAEITKEHDIILVSCDKARPPSFAERVATKVGARLVYPAEDLKVAYKKELASSVQLRNDHERDAFASAAYCYKEYAGLFSRIKDTLGGLGKMHLLSPVTKLVVINETPIAMAVEIVEKPQEKKVQVVKEAIEKKELSKEFIEFYDRVKRLEKENSMLKKQNEKLAAELKVTQQKQGYMKKKLDSVISNDKAKRLISVKEDRLAEQYSLISAKDDEISGLQKRIAELRQIIASLNGKVVVKKMQNLSYEEYQRKKAILNNDEIILVEDASTFSEKAAAEMKKTVKYVILRSKVKTRLPFVVLILDYPVDETREFAFIERKRLDEMIAKSNMIVDILDEYKKERGR